MFPGLIRLFKSISRTNIPNILIGLAFIWLALLALASSPLILSWIWERPLGQFFLLVCGGWVAIGVAGNAYKYKSINPRDWGTPGEREEKWQQQRDKHMKETYSDKSLIKGGHGHLVDPEEED